MSRLLAWYGDDFTGSTDVLESLAVRGIESVLFLHPPDEAGLAPFAGYAACGLAGSSRSRTPEWMEANLPEAFDFLGSLSARVVHYKVCSTFDSSPETGSIGRALEIGKRCLNAAWVPLVVGAPALGRYTAFGHLFAAGGGEVHRIDRHPTMSRHPVTPMCESDLRLHLAAQTSLPVALLAYPDLGSAEALQRCKDTAPVILLDVLDDASLARVGRILWDSTAEVPLFTVGSSGVEYALAAHWQRTPLNYPPPAAVDQLLVVSGSCSPVTARQIHAAAEYGFRCLSVLDDPDAPRAARQALEEGHSVVLYSAAGPETQRADLDRDAIAARNAALAAELLDEFPAVRRLVVAGGDTSSAAGAQLNIDALTFAAPLAPGAPLCRAWSTDPRRHGLEVVFKGGQCGGDLFFVQAKGDN